MEGSGITVGTNSTNVLFLPISNVDMCEKLVSVRKISPKRVPKAILPFCEMSISINSQCIPKPIQSHPGVIVSISVPD